MSPSNKKKHGKAKATAAALPHGSNNVLPTIEPTATAHIAPLDEISASATRVAFEEFIALADLGTIKYFLATAYLTPEGQNLQHLWDRAFEEGHTAGRNSFTQSLEKKLEDAHDRGYEQGFREGSLSKIDVFQAGIEEGRRDEQGGWMAEGHGEHCFKPPVIHEDSSIQTNLPPVVTTVESCTQTQDDAEDSLQSSPPLTPTLPIVLKPSSEATLPPQPSSRRLDWADDAASLPILSRKPPPRDLSILRSSSPKPFSSLQRRNNRSQTRFSHPFHSSFPLPRRTFSNHRNSPLRTSTTTFRTARANPISIPQSRPAPALNWEDDPCLVNLSRALKALGWVRG